MLARGRRARRGRVREGLRAQRQRLPRLGDVLVQAQEEAARLFVAREEEVEAHVGAALRLAQEQEGRGPRVDGLRRGLRRVRRRRADDDDCEPDPEADREPHDDDDDDDDCEPDPEADGEPHEDAKY